MQRGVVGGPRPPSRPPVDQLWPGDRQDEELARPRPDPPRESLDQVEQRWRLIVHILEDQH